MSTCPNASDEKIDLARCQAQVRARDGATCVYRQCRNPKSGSAEWCKVHAAMRTKTKFSPGSYKLLEGQDFATYLTQTSQATTQSLDAIQTIASQLEQQVKRLIETLKALLQSLRGRLTDTQSKIVVLERERGTDSVTVQELRVQSGALASKERELQQTVDSLRADRENSVALISDLEEQIQALSTATVALESRVRAEIGGLDLSEGPLAAAERR